VTRREPAPTLAQLREQATAWRLAAERAREVGNPHAAERAERNARSCESLAADVERNPRGRKPANLPVSSSRAGGRYVVS